MTFTSTITFQDIKGTERYSCGTFASTGGDTGGDINTGMTTCKRMVLQYTGSAVVESAPVINETLPCAGNAVTIVTVANTTGIWEAYGI